MSVCIATCCEGSTVLVTATDRLWSHGYASSEASLKASRIGRKWMALIAGDDISIGSADVIRELRSTLGLEDDVSSPTLLEVKSALMGAWRDVQNQVTTAAVLAPFNLTLAEFVKNGRVRFGDALFTDMVRQIQERSRLQLQLLVCGFDDRGKAALLVHDDDYGCRDYTRIGYVAIGSGHASALASLAFHQYTSKSTLNEAIYQVCTAKFMAESATGVGKDTIVICQRDDGKTCWIFGTAIKFIREMWEKRTRPRVPPTQDIDGLVTPIVDELGWQDL